MASELDLVALLLTGAHIVLGGIATVLVSANRKPSAAIAWVLTIIFVPFLGVVAFLLVGMSKLPEDRRNKQRLVNEIMEERTPGLDTLSHGEEWPAWLASMVALNRKLGALPMVGGNELALTAVTVRDHGLLSRDESLGVLSPSLGLSLDLSLSR